MTLRLPPKHVVFPSNAVFRKYPPPPDLWETWKLIRAIAWVNRYEFTPPASLAELLALHHDLKARALEYRLQRLEATGWLKVQRTSGRASVYIPTVPDDKPIDYSTETAVHGGEPASVIRQKDGEDSARHAPIVNSAGQLATPAIDCGGDSSSSLNLKISDLVQENETTTTSTSISTPATEILAAANVRVVDLDLSEMTIERAEQIAEYVRDNPGKKNSPAGFAYTALKNNPLWMPPKKARNVWWSAEYDRLVNACLDEGAPDDQDQSPRNDAPTDSHYRADGAGDIWYAALGELQLQMTKAAFDTWVRPTRALGWDSDTDATLVVGVHSQYAREWIENRLHTTIARTVRGIVEHAVEIRYEVVK
jgi:hypothetical protein